MILIFNIISFINVKSSKIFQNMLKLYNGIKVVIYGVSNEG